ncbi:SDR family NAD(P)-dependent oxidoreductase [Microvirga sesbaniae]|uniref:SDR family NAD(P)-dependent oxidoreductase n=1 Tax=Microvirga sesbaniae TaxID=681392 RepID=UPI0021C8267D|nr:SDR family oxidoreductase [Microvirga sp. HBU67692]
MSNDTTEQRPAALIFGGSRGIGAAAAKRLAEDGFRVALTYVAHADKAEDVVTAIRSQGGEAFAIRADSADPAAIRSAVSQATERFGTISAVVVNAGIFKMATLDAVSLEELDQMIAINVRGVFLSIQATVPHMADGGRVITIGSNVAIRTGFPGSSVYQFTKAAVAAMVKGLALDLAPRRITVNNIQPGPTNTDINAGSIQMLSSMSPLKRVADPAEIAGAVSYLARSESGYMTGASLTIDGGFVL